MTNLFVEASCLAFPPKAEESFLEHENIREFLCGIRDLDTLINRNPDITVSIRRGIEDFLKKENVFYNMEEVKAQKDRIISQRNLRIPPREVERIYPALFNPRKTIRYNSINTHNNPTFKQELENVITHISCLMNRYGVKNQRLVVNKVPQSEIGNTIQVSKINTLMHKKFDYTRRFDTFESAFNEIKNNYADTICFGDDIYTDKDSLFLKNKDEEFNSQDIPDRLFYYLDNLSKAAQYLRNLPNELPEEDIDGLVNSFGCNSAPDTLKSKNCSYRYWHDGTEKRVFNLHLRPKTGQDKDTMRIYYKWRNDIKKIVIGMICKHPPNCYPKTCSEFDKCDTDAAKKYRPFERSFYL